MCVARVFVDVVVWMASHVDVRINHQGWRGGGEDIDGDLDAMHGEERVESIVGTRRVREPMPWT